MVNIFHSIILGAVQGISEFLPISSSGHLVLFPYVFKWDYSGLSFDIALHFGTLIAIIAYFWCDWTNIIANAMKSIQSIPNVQMKNDQMNAESPELNRRDKCPPASLDAKHLRAGQMINGKYPPNFLWQIVLASIPAAILGLILDNYVEQYFHSPLLIAFNLAFFGIVLWLIDKYAGARYKIQDTRYKQSFLIGCAQAIALFPGVSRSGITMTAGRFFGLNKKDAARFSFLLATPAMLGAFLLSAKDIGRNDINLVFLLAMISSTIFGFLAIKYLLKYLERGSFSVFVWYRIMLALIIVAIYIIR